MSVKSHHTGEADFRGYLASALTGLSGSQRRRLFRISDIIEEVCSANSVDLYQPRFRTDPVHHSSVPDNVVFAKDKANVLSADLLVFIADWPSTGAGQELIFASQALI